MTESTHVDESTSSDLVGVRLIDLPLDVYQRTRRHQEALQREFDLVRAGDTEPASFPNRLAVVIQELDGRFGRFATAGNQRLEAAVAEGRRNVDVTYQVPVETREAALRLAQLLDEADDYCQSGDHLLTLATPPEARAFRTWFLGQIVAQIDGDEPTPWPAYLAAIDLTGPEPEPEPAPAGESIGGAAAADAAPSAEDLDLPAGWGLETGGGTSVVRLAGALDLDTAPALRDVLQSAREVNPDVVVDARAVEFIDSVAISVLVTARNRLVDDAGGLRMQASAVAYRSLELAGLIEALAVER